MNYYLVQTKSICEDDRNWARQFLEENACPECYHVYPQNRIANIDVVLAEKPDRSALNGFVKPDIDIARRDFMELFLHEAKQYFNLGKVYLSNGKLLNDYVTFAGKKRILLRGKKPYSINPCSKCGNLRYTSLYPWHIVQSSLSEQPLYGVVGGGLLMTEDLRTRIEKGKWRGIEILKIPVYPKPLDGFDDLREDLIW